jgi:hypothetical protein
LLTNRVKDLQNLGAAETKLLYTLHWILLFAADECADNEDGKKDLNPYDYLFSIPTISVSFILFANFLHSNNFLVQLFVYLFAPIAHHLKESDFQNFRLESGIKLWQGMWEYRSPGIQCFMAPVKPKARQFLQQTTTTTPQSNENVFVGKNQNDQHHESPTNTSLSETPRHDDDISSICIASPKEPVFPETIPEEASSIEEEHVLLFRLPQGPDPIFYTADASLLHQSHFHSSRRSSKSSLQSKDRFHDKHTTKFDFDKIEQFEKKHDDNNKAKGSSSTERESVDTDIKSPQYQKGDQKGFDRQG